ncbi:hypothetical protein JCM3770_002039 [Rhodotorula araucariae]
MQSRKRTLPADWALANPLRPAALRRLDLATSLFTAPGAYSRQTALAAHHSCVNALALSRPDPRWLATGGDDTRLLLWDTHHIDHDHSGLAPDPQACYRGARSNIFSIAFSCDGARIFSAGNDAAILSHDLEASSSTFPHPLGDSEGVPPVDVWLDHDDSVMGLSAHPSNPALFLSASSDGALHAFDTRTSPGRVGTIVDMCGMNDIVHHPITPELFVYSAEHGQMGLIDGRMGWGAASGEDGREARIAREVAVVQYDTTVARQDRGGALTKLETARPNVSSGAITPSGSLVCATLSGHLPTLFELSSATPLACFSSPAPATAPVTDSAPRDFPRGYRNTTTTKHGSFGGGSGAEPGRGLYYAAGSDDFRAYVWAVPSVEALREGRRAVGEKDLGDRVAAIAPASQILTGHRSVVNTALFHPALPVLYTAGVEKLVVRHAPAAATATDTGTDTPSPSRRWAYAPRAPATHASHPGLIGPADAALAAAGSEGPESAGERERRLRAEDVGVLEYFDGLVEAEGDEVLWDEAAGRGEDGASSSDCDGSEDDEHDRLMSDEDEAVAAAGVAGTTRRILRMLDALAHDAAPRGAERRAILEHAAGDDDDVDALRETLLDMAGEGGTESGRAQHMLRRFYSRPWLDADGPSDDDDDDDDESDASE